jgi:splicing factor 45
VRYNQPSNAEDNEDGEADYDDRPSGIGSSGEPREEERSSRPGQLGFAKRLMSKYGWTQGTGLGADESGIINPLRVQVDKRRKKADADGGGWAEPGGKGKIIGSKRKEEASKFGRMSEVIVLQNMLDDMPDLQSEIADGLGQEIGEECGEKVYQLLPPILVVLYILADLFSTDESRGYTSTKRIDEFLSNLQIKSRH